MSARRTLTPQGGHGKAKQLSMTDQKDMLDKITALQREVEQLRRALVSHAVVDQAIGVLRAVHGLGGQESWAVLQQVSQHTNTKLRKVATAIVRWAESGQLPDTIASALHKAVSATVPARPGPPLHRSKLPPRAGGPGTRRRALDPAGVGTATQPGSSRTLSAH